MTQDPNEPDDGEEEPDEHTHDPKNNWITNEIVHWHECDCGQKFNKGIHISGSWKIINYPTVETDGLAQKSCITCGCVLETDILPKLEFSYGDVNMNGMIDSMDYTFIKRAYYSVYAFNESQKIIADVNKNNKIDSMDYILVKRIYFGTYVA